jgi:hypothetical protein
MLIATWQDLLGKSVICIHVTFLGRSPTSTHVATGLNGNILSTTTEAARPPPLQSPAAVHEVYIIVYFLHV